MLENREIRLRSAVRPTPSALPASTHAAASDPALTWRFHIPAAKCVPACAQLRARTSLLSKLLAIWKNCGNRSAPCEPRWHASLGRERRVQPEFRPPRIPHLLPAVARFFPPAPRDWRPVASMQRRLRLQLATLQIPPESTSDIFAADRAHRSAVQARRRGGFHLVPRTDSHPAGLVHPREPPGCPHPKA